MKPAVNPGDLRLTRETLRRSVDDGPGFPRSAPGPVESHLDDPAILLEALWA